MKAAMGVSLGSSGVGAKPNKTTEADMMKSPPRRMEAMWGAYFMGVLVFGKLDEGND
jgi:hypothetical protein